MYEKLKAGGVEKPLITAYLPSYDPCKGYDYWGKTPLKIYSYPRKSKLLTRLTSFPVPLWEWLKKPIPAQFISLHFIFTEGNFNRELLFDPEIYFFGDEIVTSLRAYLLGYNFYHPHRIIGWHTFNRNTRRPHWEDHSNWYIQEQQSVEKIEKIYNGTYQYENINNRRSIEDYEDYIFEKLIEK
jgi:hypothetical protein